MSYEGYFYIMEKNPVIVMHDISRLEALAFLVWILFLIDIL